MRTILIAILFFEAALPGAASSQLSHPDSVLALTVKQMVQPLGNSNMIIAGDSSLGPLIAAMPQTVGLCLPQFWIEDLSATIDNLDTADLDINLRGVLLDPGQTQGRSHFVTRSVRLITTGRERKLIESNRDPFVHLKAAPTAQEGSVWSSVIAPILIVAGAAAVVALFFLVRG